MIICQLLVSSGLECWLVVLCFVFLMCVFVGELCDLLMRVVERGLDGLTLVELGWWRGCVDWVAVGEFLEEY